MTRLQLLASVVGFLAAVLTLGSAFTGVGAASAVPAVVVVVAVAVIVLEHRRVAGRRARPRR